MESQRLKIYNGQIITPSRIIPMGTIIIDNAVITEIKEGDIEIAGATEIDAGGNYISPGFIDIHIHGGGGHALRISVAVVQTGEAEIPQFGRDIIDVEVAIE